MPSTDLVKEAERLMVICNACRYCEGHCAVFPAMEMRVAFPAEDLRYLANLCHNCGACLHACPYAPPHPFDVNVPRVFDALRRESYAHYAWPKFLAPLFQRNGLATAVMTAASCVIFTVAGTVLAGPEALRRHLGPGAFYKVVPHWAMVLLFGLTFGYALIALAAAVQAFWRDCGVPRRHLPAWVHNRATRDSMTLRYLDGGGDGCTYPNEKPSMSRRWWHHFTFYGFLLCFAATCVAAVYDWLGHPAPYPWWSAPVMLGTAGGIGLVIGTVGLLVIKADSDRAPNPRTGMDVSFLFLLLLTSVTGFLVLFFRTTSAMGILLLIHLGVVMGLFLTMPYGKFIHGFFRYAALARYAVERSNSAEQAPSKVV